MKYLMLMVLFLLFPSVASAFVPHSYPEIYIHQMGHLFFIISCGFVIRTIIRSRLQREKGWRYILFAEIFFILWNLDTGIGHITEYWIEPSQIIGSKEGWDYFRRLIIIDGREYLYYMTKHDHIWLVTAMLLFYAGLKEHLRGEEKPDTTASAVLPLLPIILLDMTGSFMMIVLSLMSLDTAIKLNRKDRDNTLWNYLLWLSSSYVLFSLSRSIGHILQRLLIPMGYENIWKYLEPYSGSLNTFTFIVIGAQSLFFFRAYETYLKMLKDKIEIEIINSDLAKMYTELFEDKEKIEVMNSEITELNDELETMVSERTMGLMALTVADRIRNPASVIGLTCQRILEKDEGPQKLADNLKSIIDESRKLEIIVKDFEALLKSKKSVFKYEDINEIIMGVVKIVGKEAHEKGLELSVNLEAQLQKMNTQKNLMRAAVFHLIRNAIDATPPGGRITIMTSSDSDHVKLSVSDNGTGIPKEDFARIFDPFFSTKKFRFGMGLPLIKQIVSEHLGDISVESEEGKGATFHLSFPVRWHEQKPA